MSTASARSEDRLLDLLDRLRRLGPGLPPFEDVGLSPSQFTLLAWIARAPGCGIQEIATGLGLTPPTVSVAVRRLEETGLLERQPDPQDGRAIQLFLTAQGRALHQRMRAFRREKMRRLLAGLTLEERATLLDLLERTVSAAEAGQVQNQARSQ